MPFVLRLRQAVRIEEEQVVLRHVNRLRLKGEFRFYAQRQVRQHIQSLHSRLSTLHFNRCIMSRIAESEFARLAVEYTEEEREEHVLFVLVAERPVDLTYYRVGLLLMRGDTTEKRTRGSHH